MSFLDSIENIFRIMWLVENQDIMLSPKQRQMRKHKFNLFCSISRSTAFIEGNYIIDISLQINISCMRLYMMISEKAHTLHHFEILMVALVLLTQRNMKWIIIFQD